MANYINLVDFFNVEKIKIVCDDGKHVDIKRSVFPKIGILKNMIQEMDRGDPAFVNLDGFKVEPVSKIVEWLHHYEVFTFSKC